jgi:LmbE family N-acetylglucosaminyl deacetylase
MKTLIISPHADDDVLGAYGFLNGASVIYCGLDEGTCPKDPKHRIPICGKMKEIGKVSKKHKFTWTNLGDLVNCFTLIHLIPRIEETINIVKPDILLIPYPSTNQDHRTVYDACMIALRHHDKNHWIKKVLVYECPQSFFNNDRMDVNYYREIDINDKIKTYKLYKSQVRSFRSPEHIKHMAKDRGFESQLPYAEAYRVLRWIE